MTPSVVNRYPPSICRHVDSNDPTGLRGVRARLETIDRSCTDGFLRFCANAVLVTALMPYVSPVVLQSLDVQLMALATALSVLFGLAIVAPEVLKFCNTDYLILALGLLTLVYVDPGISGMDMEVSLRACAPVIMGFPIYLAVRSLYLYISPRVVIADVGIYFLALVLQLSFPAAYSSTFGHLLSDTRFAPEEGRGPNGLTPEPSMMGNMCVLFVVSLFFFHRQYWREHKRAARSLLAASIAMLIATKSATGIVLVMVVGLVALFGSRISLKRKAAVLSGVLVAVMSIGEALSLSNARGSIVLSSIATNPLNLLQDYSFATRGTNLFVGLYQLPDAPFGNGDVRPNVNLTVRALSGDIAILSWPDSTFRKYMVDVVMSRDNISGLGGMVQRMGVTGIFVAIALVYLIRGFDGKWAARAFVLGLFLNASLFIPTLWFIIGCCVELQRTAEQKPRSLSPTRETPAF